MNFACVYILQSFSTPEHFYVGFTEDLRARLQRHNAGEVPHTAKFRPWRIKNRHRLHGPEPRPAI
jgi:predicted GIY-YIG superfamily endonuclease